MQVLTKRELRVVILRLYKIDFKKITRDKESHYILKKGSIEQDYKNLNIYITSESHSVLPNSLRPHGL